MAEFDRYTNNYSSLLNESLAPLGGFDDYYLQRKVMLVEKLVPKAAVKSVLDFGCGIGTTTSMLQKAFAGARIVGADISEASIGQARRNNTNIEFGCTADEAFMASSVKSFDLIYVANVFHHIPPIERINVMNVLKNMLTPNGRVCFFEHNPYNPLTKWVVSRCEFDRDAILLPPRESRRLFTRTGFSIDSTTYLLFFPHILKILAKTESYFKHLPLGAQYCISASLNS